MQFDYLLIDLGSIAIPFAFSFHPRLRFDKMWIAFWPATAIAALIFILWDLLYTHLGVWGFNGNYLTGIYLGNLPIEEILFFICIPYACVFTYHCFNVLLPDRLKQYSQRPVSVVLIATLLVVGVSHVDNLYTSVTFISLGLFISVLEWTRQKWLALFYITYAVLILPFFVVNGMLTGTGFEEPIVWYDDMENLGIRMLTIPVEDIFYGMLLILLNVAIYERLLKFRRTLTSNGRIT